MKIQGTARVQITVEVFVSVWGEECSIGQLYKQAAEAGVDKVRKVIEETRVVMIGDPKVIGVLTEVAS